MPRGRPRSNNGPARVWKTRTRGNDTSVIEKAIEESGLSEAAFIKKSLLNFVGQIIPNFVGQIIPNFVGHEINKVGHEIPSAETTTTYNVAAPSERSELINSIPSLEKNEFFKAEEGTQKKARAKTAAKVFKKPTLEEVKAYCLERKNSVDPEAWFDHYESNGWRVGKVPMKSWKAAVRTWEKNDFGSTPKKEPWEPLRPYNPETDGDWRD